MSKFKYSCDDFGIPRKSEGFRQGLSIDDREIYDREYRELMEPLVRAHQSDWDKPIVSRVNWNMHAEGGDEDHVQAWHDSNFRAIEEERKLNGR